jgi:hypothetical protein
MTESDEEFEISEVAPTDDEGHPIHPDPDKDHRICGAEKSDRTTPTDHGRERDDVPYCTLRAGWGTDSDVGACTHHPYKGSQIGKSNPNFKHGRTSEYFRSKLSDRQEEVYDEIVETLEDEDQDPEQILNRVFGRLLLVGEGSLDASLLREARQWASEFGVLETEPDKHEVEHSGSVDTEVDVPDHIAEAIANSAEANLEDGDEG